MDRRSQAQPSLVLGVEHPLLRIVLMIRPSMLLTWLIVPAVVCFVGARSAAADAHYERSNPSRGQVLASQPPRIDLFLTRSLSEQSQVSITVVGPEGTRVDDGAALAENAARTDFSVGLLPRLAPGRYAVSLNANAANGGDVGHVALAFYVQTRPTAAQHALDEQMAAALKSGLYPSSYSSSDLLVAVGAALAAALACSMVLILLQRALYRRRRGQGQPVRPDAAEWYEDSGWFGWR